MIITVHCCGIYIHVQVINGVENSKLIYVVILPKLISFLYGILQLQRKQTQLLSLLTKNSLKQ